MYQLKLSILISIIADLNTIKLLICHVQNTQPHKGILIIVKKDIICQWFDHLVQGSGPPETAEIIL